MSKGWISIHRKIKEHWLWKDKPFSKGQVWIDMLMMANHEDNKFILGNELIDVKRGSFVTSEVKLSEQWGWTRKRTRSFLSVLELDQMLTKKSTTKYTTITIVNYDLYQDTGTTKEHEKNNEGTTEEHQKNINNNEKNNDNNVNKNKISKKGNTTSYDELINSYTTNPILRQILFDYIAMRVSKRVKPTNKALALVFKDLDKLSNNDDVKIKILENSIKNCWTGIFELKEVKGGVSSGTNSSHNGTYNGIDTSKFRGKLDEREPDDTDLI